MAHILNNETIRQAARTFINFNSANVTAVNDQLNEWLNALNQVDGADPSFTELTALLSLDDEQFNILAPIFLDELQKSTMDTQSQIMLAQACNLKGIKLEDIHQEIEEASNQIDQMIVDGLPASKGNFFKELISTVYNSIASAENIAKRIVDVFIEPISPDAKLPAYAHVTDAGMDVYALEDITINPGETKLIPLGLKVAIPEGYELQVRAKSGRCLKTKLRVANAPGTIDAGYRDEIGVIIDNIDPPIRAIHPRRQITDQGTEQESIQLLPINEGDIEYGQSYTIGKGEKFAQLVLSEVPKVNWVQVNSVASIGEDRGGGYGSSGLK